MSKTNDCPICKEKERRIHALIKGHKRLQKVILGLMITLIVTAFLGRDGIILIKDFIQGVIK